ncbi:hypothetical protein HD554DRAFT_2170906 [Boletus coccyginus]|nr:hypothetical protein HD554DRAFT_2170906 [Boletus coccyginus]
MAPRPTLPPLHSLDLPRGDTRTHHCCPTAQLNPNPPTASPPMTSTGPFPARKVRLVPTSFENADAVVLVPPPSAPNVPPPPPLLLVGPALARLRHHQCQLAKGARIHPYRVARGPSDQHSPTRPSHAQV